MDGQAGKATEVVREAGIVQWMAHIYQPFPPPLPPVPSTTIIN